MPEGDTIHKVAALMHEALAGSDVQRCVIHGRDPSTTGDLTVDRVVAYGKHLFVHFDDGRVLRSHLGMHGSWHRYPRGATWRKPLHKATIELHADPLELVCFSAKETEWMREGSFRYRDLLAFLGPDVVEEQPDLDAVVQRARQLLPGDVPLVDVLLDQRVASGIGNVYKSEILFIHRLHPLRTLESIPNDTLTELFTEGHRLLRRNLGGGPRVTRDDGRGRLWVYGRRGEPCGECAASITFSRAGKHLRTTYHCARCQPERSPTSSP